MWICIARLCFDCPSNANLMIPFTCMRCTKIKVVSYFSDSAYSTMTFQELVSSPILAVASRKFHDLWRPKPHASFPFPCKWFITFLPDLFRIPSACTCEPLSHISFHFLQGFPLLRDLHTSLEQSRNFVPACSVQNWRSAHNLMDTTNHSNAF